MVKGSPFGKARFIRTDIESFHRSPWSPGLDAGFVMMPTSLQFWRLPRCEIIIPVAISKSERVANKFLKCDLSEFRVGNTRR
jgi:hypothetical protein